MKKRSVVLALTLAMGLLLASVLLYALAVAQPTSSASPQHGAQAGNAWSSGWVTIRPGQTITLTHQLGLPPEQLGLELWFMDVDGHGGINRAGYGGLESKGSWYGAYWHHFTANSISITRFADDKMADKVLVRVWAIDPPEYDSGWIDMPKRNVHIDHNLGITPTDVVASMWFSGTAKGIHHYGYGTLTVGREERGAYWMRLTDTSIELYRRAYDEDAEQVRVVISRPEPPAYDSMVALGDWVDTTPGGVVTFTHNLNWDPGLLTVRADCYDTTSNGQGIHQSYAGGDVYDDTLAQGHHIQNLTRNSLRFVRRKNDTLCDRVRVRIWKRNAQRRIHLPVVMAGGTVQVSPTPTPTATPTSGPASTATPTPTPTPLPIELGYDDGTAESNQSYTTGNGFAVRFSPPGEGVELLSVRYYFIAPVAPIDVHVWDLTGHDLLRAHWQATPVGDGWFEADISSAKLVLTEDFYVGFKYTQDYAPTLGVDTSAPDGYSYEWPWELKTNLDYMIRVVVQRK